MALNPFFLQGSANEQNLMQELINEQLKIYGVEVTYIPRKIVNRSTVLEELETSRFDDNFLLDLKEKPLFKSSSCIDDKPKSNMTAST